ncbi:sugar ABC transporter substrate-binding protein [Aureibacillus halotolerans]|uniref:Carbohydrate ABC transporter substrate-binding protein (CUT1 family) n=1 Tax=Aureibacillus halotolerans TaxID=1508390 RepID=A0A4R6TZ96_9BACI|nr:sugar ABC transporter substrate-binding protein [Aureibacillus halotolerans]TDQ37663.1 carbohydrate ABC transporter substrate-binding protein (CUT1 family) [Aureibacillus halotolerans]
MKKMLFMLFTAFVMMLAGCSESTVEQTPDGEDVVTLDMAIVAGTSEMPAWQGIVDAFNGSHENIQVNLQRLPGSWDDYAQRMTTQIAAGDPPDIGRLNATIKTFEDKGYLTDLTPYFESLDTSLYTDGLFQSTDEHMYGVPIVSMTQVLFYNKDMFDEAGVAYPPMDWEDPWTWEEFAGAAEALSSGSGGNRTYGVHAKTNIESGIPTYLWSNGGSYFNDDMTEVTFDSPEAVETLTFIQDLIIKGYAPTPAETSTIPASDMFTSGRLGMMIEGPWNFPSFSEIDSFEWGVAPIPVGPSGEKPITTQFVDYWVAYEGSDHHEEAAEVIQFFIGAEALGILVDNNIGGVPILKSVAEDKKEELFSSLTDEEKDMIYESYQYSRLTEATTNFSELQVLTQRVLDLLALDELGPEEAVKQLEPIFIESIQTGE